MLQLFSARIGDNAIVEITHYHHKMVLLDLSEPVIHHYNQRNF